jgi:aspartyl/asparaginyl-tRNA synthetase/glutamate mutase epsilon subunit
VTEGRSPFGDFVDAHRRAGTLLVQPRMGFADRATMRSGLLAVRDAGVPAVGTVTLDSYTRQGDHDRAALATGAGIELNGYPLVAEGPQRAAEVLDGVATDAFPVQVRHGSAQPEQIFTTMLAAGVHVSEGGPVSYCLPYSRVPLRTAARAWARAVRLLARQAERGVHCHLESFGGCMLGQLCPPGLLVALSVLECLFFVEHGVRSVSASYAQQTDPDQDAEALWAIRRLCGEELGGVDHHVVLYTYMGLFPESAAGARVLLRDSALLAVRTGTERLIVKTTAEAHRIPTITENVDALRLAHRHAQAAPGPAPPPTGDTEVYQQARLLIDAVRELAPTLAEALPRAFELGLLDVPYCLHPDNHNTARCVLDGAGRLVWWDTGLLPLPASVGGRRRGDPPGATRLVADLNHQRRRLDQTPHHHAAHKHLGEPAMPDGHRADTHATDVPGARPPADRGPRPPGDPREHLCSPTTRDVLRIQQRMLAAVREHLGDQGFMELLPPIIGPVTDPGIRGSKQVDVDFYGHRYKLMTSAILYKQASLLAFDKIFYIAPNIRMEPLETASTSRHLAEFHQIDVEVAGASRDDIVLVLQDLVKHVVRRVTTDLPEEFERLGRDVGAFTELLSRPFDRMSHACAVDTLRGLGHDQSPDAEIDWAGEVVLSRKAAVPYLVTDYPKGSRGFYDRENPDEPGLLLNFDLIAPEGYGELCSGSEREFDYSRIVTRMRETGENPAKYRWYLDLVREGIPGSAGFGVGVERLTRYVAGLDAVWQANAYPKLPGVVSP